MLARATTPRGGAVAAAVLVFALAAVACVGTDDRQLQARATDDAGAVSSTPATSTPMTGPTTAAPSSTAGRGPLGSGSPVTLAFAGDASFEGLEAALAQRPGTLLSEIAPVLGAADVTVVNLEAALTAGGTPEPKTFTFRVPPAALDALAAAGVDAVTLANNHGMDYGRAGLEETLEIRDSAAVAVIGVGRDAQDAYSPYVTEVRGQRIGVIAANDVFDSNLVASWTATDDQPGIASAKVPHQERLVAAVRDLRDRVDTLAVYLHFGTERDTCPHDRQRELVGVLVDAGADIVVGSHAHRLQGLGYLGDRFVAYGLSNFVFRSPSAEGRRSGVLTITATGRRIDGFEWAPAVIRDLVPVPLQGTEAEAELAAMDGLRECAGLRATAAGEGTT